MRRFEIGLLAVIMLVLLRITIGWHFLYQGVWKLQHQDFSSEGFLRQAKGPLAERYYALIPDFWGRERLNPEHAAEPFAKLRADFGQHYQLDQGQAATADRILAAQQERVADFFADNKDALDTYWHELERLERTRQSDPTRELEFQKKRLWDKQKELEGKVNGWLAQFDTWQKEMRGQLDSLLTPEQRGRGSLPVPSKTAEIDNLITLSNVAIGLCLMVGFLTRFASLSGAMFLLSIILAQPELPGIYPPAPAAAGRALVVNKEFVEMMAMLALAATPVGRWAGLDFVVHRLIVQPLFGRRNRG